jgi:hypothetical protein
MKSFTFQAPANILFEAGAVRKIGDLVLRRETPRPCGWRCQQSLGRERMYFRKRQMWS